ncbi:odorant receptor 4-like [Phymastichus coffea]|uniref:odorant receptor 4-like n=1 Tax=Phymastichus coffea TaxID=108790 RepID=UPI00273CD30B|nr:odorant receptor 4-like [Phymastichus coffea]
MAERTGYDVAVAPCRALLRFLGAWPDPKIPEDIFAVLRFVVATLTMILFANVAQTIMVVKVWGDLNSMIEILTTANIPIFIACVKFLVAWFNRKILKKLVILMAEDWRRKYSTEDEDIMWENAYFSRKLSIVCISLALGTITAQFIMVVVFDANNRDSDERTMYMTSYFPYDIQRSPNFEITWLGQLFSNVFAASAFSAIDAFFAVLMLHLCAQLAILRKTLSKLVNDPRKNIKDGVFINMIGCLVERHEHLNKFASVIEKSFNTMFLGQMVASSFALCLQGYQLVVITSNTENGLSLLQLIHMIYFTCCFSFSLFVYCYVAERLQYESTEIGYAAYQSDWYNWNPEETKLLLLMMHRARKPLQITAGKFCFFSLRLYCSILKTSGGYLSMLLAVKDRIVLDE